MHTKTILLLAVLCLGGCQTPTPLMAPPLPPPTEPTMSWENQGLGGASETVPGYVHVLRRGGPVFREAAVPTNDAIPAGTAPIQPAAPVPGPMPSAAPVPPAPSGPHPAPVVYQGALPAITLAGINAVTGNAAAEALTPVNIAATPAPTPVKVTASAAPALDNLRRAWMKYCDGGYRMTDADWQAVRDAGAPDKIPADLANHCVPPK